MTHQYVLASVTASFAVRLLEPLEQLSATVEEQQRTIDHLLATVEEHQRTLEALVVNQADEAAQASQQP